MTETDDANEESTPFRESLQLRKIARVLGLVVLLAVVLPFVVYAVPQVVGADHSYVVLSGSMEPTMSPGDVIVIDDVAPSTIESGDVITFRRGGDERPTTHRVIEVVQQDGGLAFRTQGDANEDPDSQLVSPDAIQGKVPSLGGFLFVIPFIGHVIQFANTQMGFVALFVVPLVLLVLSEIWNVVSSSGTGSENDESGEGESAASAADRTDAATGDSSDPSTTDGNPETADGGLTFTAAELQLGLISLGAFLAYSIWVAYVTLEVWAFGVGGSVAAAFLLLLALYLSGGGADGDGTDDGAEDGAATETTSGGGNVAPGTVDGISPEVDVDGEMNILKDTVRQGRNEATDGPQATAGGRYKRTDPTSEIELVELVRGIHNSNVSSEERTTGDEPVRGDSDD